MFFPSHSVMDIYLERYKMNESKKRDPRFWNIWVNSGAIAPHFSLEVMRDYVGLRIQCGMMLDDFPTGVLKAIEDARDNLERITEIVTAQPISRYFSKVRGRRTKIKTISALIYTFFAYRRTIGK